MIVVQGPLPFVHKGDRLIFMGNVAECVHYFCFSFTAGEDTGTHAKLYGACQPLYTTTVSTPRSSRQVIVKPLKLTNR